ncbi:MAG: hypothetical protein BGO26_04680 [Actinobacteria bacterium 69-20]|jgi:hypothetical protein|nr:hypothetical protein [Actinomycetota bacterium]OJV26895.1 MAG: hypothetical protein BGO26_04680 [Actinobacteria bacterium 69-20]
MSGEKARRRYRVAVRRDGKYWFIDVPEVQRATQARRASDVEGMARDLIAVMTNQDAAAVAVDIAWHLEPAVEAHLERSRDLRAEAQRANSESAEEARLAARALRATGLNSTDIGAVLGISRQRAHQLLH